MFPSLHHLYVNKQVTAAIITVVSNRWTGLMDWITGLTFELKLCVPHDLHPITCAELGHTFDALWLLDCCETTDAACVQLWEFCTEEILKGRPILQQMELLGRPIIALWSTPRPLADQPLTSMVLYTSVLHGTVNC